MTIAALLALGAAVGYGVGDFLGGHYTRRLGLLPVLVIGQACGAVVLAGGTAALAPVSVSVADLTWGAAAGTTGVVGGWLMLRGFQVGRFSVVAPVSAIGAAGIPLVVDVAVGVRPSALALSGVGIGLLALWLIGGGVGDHQANRGTRGGVWFGLGSGVAFAVMYLGLDQTDPGSGAWPAVAAQTATALSAAAAAAWVRCRLVVPLTALPGVASTGIAAALATLCFLLAARAGPVSIAALITSLSPAVTVLLARLVLHELLPPRRVAGLVAAGAALALIGLG